MFQFLLAMLLGFMSPSNTTTNSNGTIVSTTDTGTPDNGTPGNDTGGEHAHIPPKKP